MFSGVSNELFDVETFGKERALLTKVTKAWRVSAPPGAPLLSSYVSLLLVWWWVLRIHLFRDLLGWVGCPVALPGRYCFVLRGAVGQPAGAMDQAALQ